MTIAQDFLDRSRYYLSSDYLPKIRLAVEPLDDRALWWRANDASNAIGNLMLHLAGNIRQWIVSGVGGAAHVRQRSAEFAEQGPITKRALLEHLASAVSDADAVLATLTQPQLEERRHIQGRDFTVFEALYHVVEHFSMHTGQIILLAKVHAPSRVRFYDDAGGLARPLWPEGVRS
ncbi:MAG: DinB family protein [Gemmatimonadaceae bacterium]